MMCNNCVEHVKSALTGVDGGQVLAVEVGKAEVLLQQRYSDDILREAVEKSGKYKVTSIIPGGS